ncbi:MAG: BON domain-containing protein [Gammaproteobacteria bacterium]|nr:BON domain-containing protein [Gammaproteobacteria bacterium]MBU4172608.1 BON domain-containing protein [Gammaproteobacteria bacterium]
MRTDAELKADVMERLDAIPAVNASDIEVDVDAGVVTLSGSVDTQQTRFQVERTARRVPGIRSLAVSLRPHQMAGKKHYH